MDPSGSEVTMIGSGLKYHHLGWYPELLEVFEAADWTCRGRQWQPGESCCRRPNTPKFRYAL